MAAPRKPQDRKRPALRRQPTTASTWRQRRAEPVEVPSGNVALIRAVGLQAFIKSGVIPNSLMPEVQKILSNPEDLGSDTTKELFKDQEITPETMMELLDMIDAVVCQCVVEPKVHSVPKDEKGVEVPFEERPEIEGLWVDEVDDEDKAFVFQFAVGGTRDLETFREEQAAQLESLSGSPNVAVQTQ